jgi:Spy/CpxP family protein refolding chaperone
VVAPLSGAVDQRSPYAGQQDRPIKALSAEEQADLRDGKGMGFAKAAELNGYPGPRHVLDLAEPLGLSAQQLVDTRALFDRMQEEARRQGAALIDAERVLDQIYASHSATRERVDGQLALIERIRTRLRAAHLQAHLDQAALLTPVQMSQYSRLRGYTGADRGSAQQHKGH